MVLLLAWDANVSALSFYSLRTRNEFALKVPTIESGLTKQGW